MVRGGEGAFIGAVRRIAARLDDEYVLVAGALSSTPEKARRSGLAIGLEVTRTYADYNGMARKEAQLEDSVEVVSIVAPNNEQMRAALAFIEAGVHVICDNPLTTTLENALKLKAAGISPGHAEGYLEGFANIHQEFAHAIRAARAGLKHDAAVTFPGIDDGVRGVALIEAAVASSKAGARWVSL